jgi:hypothetical protein
MMNVEEQIENYIASQPTAKQAELRVLHDLVQQIQPNTKLWFTDGTDNTAKVVANPNIGYGNYTMRYADGTTREFFRIGLSGNKTGISVYVMGIPDKSFLASTFGATIGKATLPATASVSKPSKTSTSTSSRRRSDTDLN